MGNDLHFCVILATSYNKVYIYIMFIQNHLIACELLHTFLYYIT